MMLKLHAVEWGVLAALLLVGILGLIAYVR